MTTLLVLILSTLVGAGAVLLTADVARLAFAALGLPVPDWAIGVVYVLAVLAGVAAMTVAGNVMLGEARE